MQQERKKTKKKTGARASSGMISGRDGRQVVAGAVRRRLLLQPLELVRETINGSRSRSPALNPLVKWTRAGVSKKEMYIFQSNQCVEGLYFLRLKFYSVTLHCGTVDDAETKEHCRATRIRPLSNGPRSFVPAELIGHFSFVPASDCAIHLS